MRMVFILRMERPWAIWARVTTLIHRFYVDYADGIYVGYKWYETADAEGYWDTVSNEYGNGYEGVVQYPFGYGLSYTDFDWEVTDASANVTSLTKDGEVTVKVKVTNKGSVAGKDVVELYYTAPYITGEIEKIFCRTGSLCKDRGTAAWGKPGIDSDDPGGEHGKL